MSSKFLSRLPVKLVLLLILVGFWLRVDFWLALVYHSDEFFSILAAQMVAVRGLPILPSGLFYDQGLVQSMSSGLFLALVGFREEIARWPSLVAGVLTIPVYYAAGRTLFTSQITGLLAATLITFDFIAIEWSVRARMYSLAHLFVLLTLTWLLKSFFQVPSERGRYLFLLFLAATLLSHTITFTILPPLMILTVIFTLLYRRRWLYQPRLWLQGIIGFLMITGIMLIVRMGQTSSITAFQSNETATAISSKLGFLGSFFLPRLTWPPFDKLFSYFLEYPYNWLLILVGLGLLTVIFRFKQKRATFGDWAFCFLIVYNILLIAELSILLTPVWQKTRYLFFLNLPSFLLLSAESLRRLTSLLRQWLSKLVPRIRQFNWINLVVVGAGLALIVVLMGPKASEVITAESTGNYDTAFKFVREQWQTGDKIITVNPAAAYLYLGHSDYYANQVTAKVLTNEDEDEDAPIDRYTGAPLVDSVTELNAVLSGEKRVWFVVDIKRLYQRYEIFFTQQIFSQMNHVRQFGQVYVFVSEPFPRSVPYQPDMPIEAQFDQMIRLEGYSMDLRALAPDGSLPLHLYWRPLEFPSRPFKVFVQLRNSQGEIIAQADHFIYENLITGREWQELKEEQQWLRDTAILQLPLPISPEGGPYQLFLGVYDPATLERVPLLNDTSGENAIVLPFSYP